MTQTATTSTDRQLVEDFLHHEAELLDDQHFQDWHALFTADGTYRIPLSDDDDTSRQASLVNDDPLRLDERVYHITEVPFPSQSPRSRTLHNITNVRVASGASGILLVRSNQLIAELRLGDFRQVGLGEQRILAADVRYELQVQGDANFKIASKVIYLLNRRAPIGNLTFIL